MIDGYLVLSFSDKEDLISCQMNVACRQFVFLFCSFFMAFAFVNGGTHILVWNSLSVVNCKELSSL